METLEGIDSVQVELLNGTTACTATGEGAIAITFDHWRQIGDIEPFQVKPGKFEKELTLGASVEEHHIKCKATSGTFVFDFYDPFLQPEKWLESNYKTKLSHGSACGNKILGSTGCATCLDVGKQCGAPPAPINGKSSHPRMCIDKTADISDCYDDNLLSNIKYGEIKVDAQSTDIDSLRNILSSFDEIEEVQLSLQNNSLPVCSRYDQTLKIKYTHYKQGENNE